MVVVSVTPDVTVFVCVLIAGTVVVMVHFVLPLLAIEMTTRRISLEGLNERATTYQVLVVYKPTAELQL